METIPIVFGVSCRGRDYKNLFQTVPGIRDDFPFSIFGPHKHEVSFAA